MIAALAGGLAAIQYELEDIPAEWLDTIIGRKDLDVKIKSWVGIDTYKEG